MPPSAVPDPAVVLGFPDSSAQARAIAARAGLACHDIELHRFPDGESRVRLPSRLPHSVFLVRSLHQPHDKLIELQLASVAARQVGARELTLVAPYLCYMRQDAAFAPGEVISQTIIADLLCRMVDRVVTVDPHLHRVAHLDQVITGCESLHLSAAAAIAEHLARRHPDALLAGPDAESLQWVAAVARLRGQSPLIATKRRSGDRLVEVEFPEIGRIQGRSVVLIDDILSTGRTLGQAAIALRRAGASEVHAIAIHGVFAGDAELYLEHSELDSVLTTDSIPQHHAGISLLPELGAVISELAARPCHPAGLRA